MDSILGGKGIVIKEIKSYSIGQVRLVNNSIWTAVSKNNAVIPIGTEVVVLNIEGVKLVVEESKINSENKNLEEESND